MSDDKLKVLNIDDLVRDISKIARLKINDSENDLFSDAKKRLKEIEQAFIAVETRLKEYQYVTSPQKTDTKPAYNKKPELISLFKTDIDKHADVIFTVNTQTKGLWKKTTTYDAQLLLRGRDDIVKFEYRIPENDDKLSAEKTNELLQTIETFALTNHYTPNEETALVSAITNITGINSVPQQYFSRKYERICGETNEKMLQLAVEGKKALAGFYKTLTNALENAVKQIGDEQFMHALTKEQKTLAEKNMTEEVEHAKKRLEKFEEKKRSEIEKHYDAELDAIKKMRQETQEKLAELKERYAQKREKLVKESQKILSGLEEIFPDNDWSGGYEYTIDHTLRVFYTKQLEKDLSESKHVEVDHALRLLKTLRQTCFPLNQRPQGKDLRSAYAGIEAVIDYVEKNEASVTDVMKNVETTALNNPKRQKPSVEQFLERALSHDFDMKKYEKGLHQKNATKESLGVK